MKKLKRLPKYINSAVNQVDEEIWQYLRHKSDVHMSKKQLNKLKFYILDLLNKIVENKNESKA